MLIFGNIKVNWVTINVINDGESYCIKTSKRVFFKNLLINHKYLISIYIL